jgi:hypothetical protein
MTMTTVVVHAIRHSATIRQNYLAPTVKFVHTKLASGYRHMILLHDKPRTRAACDHRSALCAQRQVEARPLSFRFSQGDWWLQYYGMTRRAIRTRKCIIAVGVPSPSSCQLIRASSTNIAEWQWLSPANDAGPRLKHEGSGSKSGRRHQLGAGIRDETFLFELVLPVSSIRRTLARKAEGHTGSSAPSCLYLAEHGLLGNGGAMNNSLLSCTCRLALASNWREEA